MDKISRFKLGALAALGTIVAGAALTGWMIGKKDAARQIAELRPRSTSDAGRPASCGMNMELLDSRAADAPPKPEPCGPALGGILPHRYLHLRQLLTSR